MAISLVGVFCFQKASGIVTKKKTVMDVSHEFCEQNSRLFFLDFHCRLESAVSGICYSIIPQLVLTEGEGEDGGRIVHSPGRDCLLSHWATEPISQSPTERGVCKLRTGREERGLRGKGRA